MEKRSPVFSLKAIENARELARIQLHVAELLGKFRNFQDETPAEDGEYRRLEIREVMEKKSSVEQQLEEVAQALNRYDKIAPPGEPPAFPPDDGLIDQINHRVLEATRKMEQLFSELLDKFQSSGFMDGNGERMMAIAPSEYREMQETSAAARGKVVELKRENAALELLLEQKEAAIAAAAERAEAMSKECSEMASTVGGLESNLQMKVATIQRLEKQLGAAEMAQAKAAIAASSAEAEAAKLKGLMDSVKSDLSNERSKCAALSARLVVKAPAPMEDAAVNTTEELLASLLPPEPEEGHSSIPIARKNACLREIVQRRKIEEKVKKIVASPFYLQRRKSQDPRPAPPCTAPRRISLSGGPLPPRAGSDGLPLVRYGAKACAQTQTQLSGRNIENAFYRVRALSRLAVKTSEVDTQTVLEVRSVGVSCRLSDAWASGASNAVGGEEEEEDDEVEEGVGGEIAGSSLEMNLPPLDADAVPMSAVDVAAARDLVATGLFWRPPGDTDVCVEKMLQQGTRNHVDIDWGSLQLGKKEKIEAPGPRSPQQDRPREFHSPRPAKPPRIAVSPRVERQPVDSLCVGPKPGDPCRPPVGGKVVRGRVAAARKIVIPAPPPQQDKKRRRRKRPLPRQVSVESLPPTPVLPDLPPEEDRWVRAQSLASHLNLGNWTTVKRSTRAEVLFEIATFIATGGTQVGARLPAHIAVAELSEEEEPIFNSTSRARRHFVMPY